MFRLRHRILRGQATELYAQLQLGMTPSPTSMRTFILNRCNAEVLASKGISIARIHAMEAAGLRNFLRQLFTEQYYSLPFLPVGLAMEYTTSPPTFSSAGPSASIIEIAAYLPTLNATFTTGVQPLSQHLSASSVASKSSPPPPGRSQQKGGGGGKGATAVVGGLPTFPQAFDALMTFLQDAAAKMASSSPSSGTTTLLSGHQGHHHTELSLEHRFLFLSHGAKLADEPMLKWSCQHHGIMFPSEITIGDTDILIRDLHRRRPVAPDRHPPAWSLNELSQWLKLPGGDGTSTQGPPLLPSVTTTTTISEATDSVSGKASASKSKQTTTTSAAARSNKAALSTPSSTTSVSSSSHPNRGKRDVANDAKLTWEVLWHTLDRYGADDVLPEKQLIRRFYDREARELMDETVDSEQQEQQHGAPSAKAKNKKVASAEL